jgi:hypothetical protein
MPASLLMASSQRSISRSDVQTVNSAPLSLMALDLFLERPTQDCGMIAAEETADLQVRNAQS